MHFAGRCAVLFVLLYDTLCRSVSYNGSYITLRHTMYGKTIPCSGDHREILQEGWPLYQVLETELMGLPRDWLSRATCADFTAAHHSTCGVHTHTHPYNVWYGATATCSGGRREILWEMWYLLQGLESEGMGLPRHVSSSATCVGFTAAHHCALPIPTILRHTPTMHRGVKADVRSR